MTPEELNKEWNILDQLHNTMDANARIAARALDEDQDDAARAYAREFTRLEAIANIQTRKVREATYDLRDQALDEARS